MEKFKAPYIMLHILYFEGQMGMNHKNAANNLWVISCKNYNKTKLKEFLALAKNRQKRFNEAKDSLNA